MSVHVRPAAASDAPALADLINAIIARGGTTAFEEPFAPAQLDRKYLSGPAVLSCVVAVDPESGRAMGFQSVVREPQLPDAWGDIATFTQIGQSQRGIGTALFAATRQRAGALGLAAINATIRADNDGGLAYYARLGFADHSVTRAVPLRDGTPVDRINKVHALNGS